MLVSRLNVLSERDVFPTSLVHTHRSLLDKYISTVIAWSENDSVEQKEVILQLENLVSYEETALAAVVKI